MVLGPRLRDAEKGWVLPGRRQNQSLPRCFGVSDCFRGAGVFLGTMSSGNRLHCRSHVLAFGPIISPKVL